MNKKLAKISTGIMGVYLLILTVIGIKVIFLCRDFSKIGKIGMDMAAGTRSLDDYISGYAMVPGAFFTLLGSSFGGVIFFLLMAAIICICIVLLIHIVISIVLIKKEKIRTDAILKLILLSVGTIISMFFLKSITLSVLMIIPLVISGMEYQNVQKEKT